ncbi:conserved protein, unknown function [Hepatocystis sp. ex Piliocolobus tephrosceles]|nr:conserved protein, unknown function [Hepatocystis sp. ex Piliocolobus tephrosceles]
MTTSQNAAIFSSDLQTFIVTKYDPLLTIVKELNDKLQISEKENYRLEKRLTRLERQMIILLKKLDVSDITIDMDDNEITKITEEETNTTKKIENNENLSTPWLFSCQLGTPLSSLQVLLEFNEKDTIELNVKLWRREEDMWINFLENISKKITSIKNSNVTGTDDNNNTINKFLPDSYDLISIRRCVKKCLLNLCTDEILIVLRNVPGKTQAIYNTATMTLVAILASAVFEAWKRIETIDPMSLGRTVLVLDGEDVGSRLRAGNKKLKIEPLN